MARPKGTGAYKRAMAEQARIACADLGATNEKLAKLFGVTRK